MLDVVLTVDFCSGFDEADRSFSTGANAGHKHDALGVRFLPEFGPTFRTPFSPKHVVNLPDPVNVSQINSGLINGDNIIPLPAADVAQEPRASVQPLFSLLIR